MLARRGSQILAFTKRDAVRLVIISALLVAGLTFVLALEDLTTMTEPATCSASSAGCCCPSWW